MWNQKSQSITAPSGAERSDVADAAQRARSLLKKRALIGAAVSAVPIPGLDWAVDAALLSRLLPRINKEFGLTPEQLDQLSPNKRDQVQKAIAMVGSVLIGKFISRDIVMRLARAVGMRMSAKQATKYVPLIGQATAAALGYATLRYLGERHIQDCIKVVEQADLDIPGRLRRAAYSVNQSSEDLSKDWDHLRERVDRPSGDSSRNWIQKDRGPWNRKDS